MLEFWGVEIMISLNELERFERELLLLDNGRSAWEKLGTVLRKILIAVLCTQFKDLILSLIWSVACIYS